MRSASARIMYQGKDITADISKYLKNITYTDVISGEADDLQITVEDREGLWHSSWFPTKGDILDVTLLTDNWEGVLAGELKLPVGLCEIDEIECKIPPSEVLIKALSVPNNTSLRGNVRSRSWEKVELKTIANDIAKEAKLKLFYDSDMNPSLERVEQTEESDLSFLLKLCTDNGLALKITDEQVVIFDEIKYEAQEATISLVSDTLKAIQTNSITSSMVSWSLRTSVRDVYKACRVDYQNSDKKAKITYTFTDPNKKEGKTLVVNQQVGSVAEAEALAKKELRNKNKGETEGSFTLLGSFEYFAGRTVNLVGFGAFDGKYIIVKAVHSLGTAYTTQIDIRRCLNGY